MKLNLFRWITTKLRNKAIIALILLGVVPLIIVGVTMNLLTTKLLNKKVDQTAEQSIDNISLIVSRDLQSFIDVAFNIAQNKNIQEIVSGPITTETEQQDVFYSIKKEILSKPLIEHAVYPYQYMLITDDGYIFTSFSCFSPDDEDGKILENILAKTYWYNYLKTSPVSRVLIVSEPNYLSPRLEEQLYICTNIFHKFDPVGLIMIQVDKYYMSRLLKSMRIADNSNIYVLNGEQCVVQADNNYIPYTNLPASLINDILSGEKSSSFNYVIGEGNQSFVTYRDLDIRDVEGSWKIIQVTALEDIKDEVNYITYVILGMILFSICIVAILVFLIDRTIVKPVLELNEFAKQILNGNLDVRAYYTREDEIGTLAKVFNQMVSKLKQYIDEIKEKEKVKRELEISVLQSQINPHFFKNTLNVVRWLAEMTGSTSISKAILSIIGLVDYNYRISEHSVSIKEEVKYLEEYLYLQKLRYQNKFTSKIAISEDILDGSILKLILQPIVENSIIHGIEKKAGLGILSIKGEKVDDKIIFTIYDNGVGMSYSKVKRIMQESNFFHNLDESNKVINKREIEFNPLKKQSSNELFLESKEITKTNNRIGIVNVIQRIKLNYGNEYGLTITSKKNVGTTVKIIIPYIKHTESN